MAKLVTKKTTTTVTEEVELIPATPGEEVNYPPPTHDAKRRGLRAAYAVTGHTPARCPA